jgi:pimeloyl-ACP methyl ester carboxylesterase
MVADLGTAVQFLQTHFSLREDAIAVGGASLGANVALLYAAAHPKVPALILLSPGINYAGIETEKPFRRYAKRPVFIAASPQDTMAFASVRRLLLQRTDSACRAAEGDGAAHGVKMFQNEAFTRKLLDWIKDTEASSKQQASEQGNSCRPSLAGSLLAAR